MCFYGFACCVAPLVFRAPRVVSGRAALCARGRRPARSPSAPRASLGASSRSPARPRHRPRAPQPGPPDPPAPSTPVGPGVLMSIHIIAEPTPNFACNSPETTSNLEFRSLELQRFRPLLKLLPIELHASFLEATRGNTVPPPTSTAARPSGPSDALHTSRAWCVDEYPHHC